jgi:hypothetical protein
MAPLFTHLQVAHRITHQIPAPVKYTFKLSDKRHSVWRWYLIFGKIMFTHHKNEKLEIWNSFLHTLTIEITHGNLYYVLYFSILFALLDLVFIFIPSLQTFLK